MIEPERYYTNQLPHLLKNFDRDVRLIRPVLAKYFGEEPLFSLERAARQSYADLIPQLPYIGGKQPFTQFLLSTAMLLALYRTSRANGKTLEETGQLVFEIDRAYLKAYPGFITRTLGYMNFSKFYLNRLRHRAVDSHLRRYADDYVFDFVEGDGQAFDYGVDYLECASCKFLAHQGAFEFAPYICPADVLYSQTLGWGLKRTTTLAENGQKCDFRFKRGGSTQVAVPPAIQPLL